MSPEPEGLRFRVEEHQRRLDEFSQELQRQRQRVHDLSNLCTSIPDHGRRIDDLEDLKLQVLVADVRNLERRLDQMATASDMHHLERKVDTMARALWTAAGSLLVAAVVFALSVASGQL